MTVEAIHNFPIGANVRFYDPNVGDVFEIVEYEVEYQIAGNGLKPFSVSVKLRNKSKEEDFSYCHPLYPVYKV